MDAIARELVIGMMLWACRSVDYRIGAPLIVAVLCLSVVASRLFGLLQPPRWASAMKEGALVFFGALCVSNIFLILFGLAPWFGTPPAM